jgi:hypothetical protein
MPLQPFMSMGHYIKRRARIPQTTRCCVGPLNVWQLYTAEGTKREIQQLLGETRKPNKQPS